MLWNIYLSGEIHSNWRYELKQKTEIENLPIQFSSPVTDHEISDKCGVEILGKETNKFWYDHKGAKLNFIRTKTAIEKADLVIVRFGEKYKQWNAAFEAGYASALSKPLIIMHNKDHQHALKEVDASALAVVETVEQIIKVLNYTIKGKI